MKYDQNKSYGYPVLGPAVNNATHESDYGNYNFDPSFNPMISPENPKFIQIEIETYLGEPTLRLAIVEKRAKLQLIVSCRETFYVKSFDVDLEMDTITVEAEDLHGLVELTLFIIATEDFTLVSKNFHEDFGDESFDIKEGNILGQSFTQEIYMQKEFYRNARSIISITSNEQLSEGEYVVSLDSDYIEISMNPTLNAKINGLMQTTSGEPIEALNAIFVPAVTHALYELEARDELNDYKWAQVLTMQLSTIESKQAIRTELYNKAQLLFKKPLSKIALASE